MYVQLYIVHTEKILQVLYCTLHACLQDRTAQDFLSMVKSWHKMKKPGAYVRAQEEQVLKD